MLYLHSTLSLLIVAESVIVAQQVKLLLATAGSHIQMLILVLAPLLLQLPSTGPRKAVDDGVMLENLG